MTQLACQEGESLTADLARNNIQKASRRTQTKTWGCPENVNEITHKRVLILLVA